MFIFKSSDAMPRYIADIATVLALPYNGEFQFRYRLDYISAEALAGLKEKIHNQKALICFASRRSPQGKEDTAEYVIPIREAEIISHAEHDGAIFIKFRAGRFVDLEEWPQDVTKLIGKGQDLSSQLCPVRTTCSPVVSSNIPERYEYENSAKAWGRIVARLNLLPQFAETFFLHISLYQKDDKHPLHPIDSFYNITPLSDLFVKVLFRGSSTSVDGRRIQFLFNEKILAVSTDSQYRITSRYDEVEFCFSPQEANIERRTFGRVELVSPDHFDAVDTSVDLRFKVVVPKMARFRSEIGAFFAALLVAGPQLLDDILPPTLKVAAVFVGAFLFAFTARGKGI